MLYDEYESYVLGFHDLNKTKFALAGGKGAKVGELSRSEGIRAWGLLCHDTVSDRTSTIRFIER